MKLSLRAPIFRLGRRGPHSARIALVAILGVCIVRAALAAEPLSIRVEPPDAEKRAVLNDRWDVFLQGAIDAGAARRVSRELEQTGEDGVDVYIDSPGGSLADGMAIGRELRRRGASTTIGKRGSREAAIEPGGCFSACVFVFLGGVYRNMPQGSVMGVHRASTSVHSDKDFDVGQVVAARVSRYVGEMGIDPGLVDRMVLAGKDEIYVLNSAELASLRVVNQGRLPPEWSTEPTGHGQELVGVQRTNEGTGKAVFNCSNGAITLISSYQAGAMAATILTEQWAHALLIDGTPVALDSPKSIEAADGVLTAVFALSADQARSVVGASSIGHIMEGARDEPSSLGYTIDVGAGAAARVRAFMQSCLGAS